VDTEDFELSKSLSKDLDEAFEKLHVPSELRESKYLLLYTYSTFSSP
jgi:hypothetical protein